MKRMLFLLLLLPPLFAAHFNVDAVLADWHFYAVMAAFISILAATLLFLLSRLLELKQLETIFKSEMVFAGSTIFIVLLLGFFVDNGEHVALQLSSEMFRLAYNIPGAPGSFSFPSDYHLTDVAILYMEPMASCAQSAIVLLYAASWPTEAASTMYQEIFMSEQATGGGAKPFVEIIKTFTKTLTFYMLVYFLLVHSLNFLKHYALFFLVLGVVLRALPPLRGAGAYIIAISLGLYFVFPFVFIFMSTLSATPLNDLATFQGADAQEHFLCTLPSFPMPTSEGAHQRWKVFEDISWLEAYGETFSNSILDAVTGKITNQLIISICLIPLVAMTATLTFVLSTTNLFGGQIPEIGRGLIKLI